MRAKLVSSKSMRRSGTAHRLAISALVIALGDGVGWVVGVVAVVVG